MKNEQQIIDEQFLFTIRSPKDIKHLSIEQLYQLSNSIRAFLIKTISETGGHFGSNLGIIELTVALHYLLDSPNDKIIFDVGHQCYVHKILTGRAKFFNTLRQKDGIAGFPRREESLHDITSVGHASVSISSGLGLLKGMALQNNSHKVICVIGDASISGGTAFEALNHAGQIPNNLIIILNDNEMSIDKNVGALHNYLSNRTAAKTYQNIRNGIERFFDSLPLGMGDKLYNLGVRCKKALKGFFFHETLFSDLGFEYAGPINGHKIEDILKALKNATAINRPTVIHIVTKKGKGYNNAENLPAEYHGVAPFKIEAGLNKKNDASFTKVFGQSLLELGRRNKKIVAITAAMGEGTGLACFEHEFPDRYFDVGIAEEHAIAFSGGLAISGLKPVVAIYSTFMQRAVDQSMQDIALQNVNAVIVMDRAGLVPNDGETHQGIFDIAIFKAIPNSYFLAPATGSELKLMLDWALKQRRLVFLRYPKALIPPEEPTCEEKLTLGQGVFVKKSSKAEILIITVGSALSETLIALEKLQAKGVAADVYNLRFVNPLDEDALLTDFRPYKLFAVVEEGVKVGGIGETIYMLLQKRRNLPHFLHLAVPNQFLTHGSRADLLKMTELDSTSIAKKVLNFYGNYRVITQAKQLKNNDFTLRARV